MPSPSRAIQSMNNLSRLSGRSHALARNYLSCAAQRSTARSGNWRQARFPFGLMELSLATDRPGIGASKDLEPSPRNRKWQKVPAGKSRKQDRNRSRHLVVGSNRVRPGRVSQSRLDVSSTDNLKPNDHKRQ